MKYLGIDYGESKVGLAVGDDESRLALPHSIIKNTGRANLLKEISVICKKEGIEKIVVGLPANTQAKGATVARKKSKDSSRICSPPQDWKWKAPAKSFPPSRRVPLPPGRRPKAGDDAVAAMVILQGYLDARIYN